MEHVSDSLLDTLSGPACAVLGTLGFLAGPFLIAGSSSRYMVLFADLGALAFGTYAAHSAYRGRSRWDVVVFGVVLAAISLTLWIASTRSGFGFVPGST
jgi:hypothetical protein